MLAASLGCGPGDGQPVGPERPPPQSEGVVLNEDLGPRPVFPPDNWWNQNISAAPVDPHSDGYIDMICRRGDAGDPCDARMHPDFGRPPYGIPYVVVPAGQPTVPVEFVLYGGESDAGLPGREPGYPIPPVALSESGYIEGGRAGGGPDGDRHLLVVDRDEWVLYELWATRWNGSAGRWEAGSGAVFDLARNDRRPEGWTSADAAGLAVFPGLVKFHEVTGSDEIRHAIRVTVRSTNGYVWPASHRAGSTPGALPLGARLRLRPDFDLTPHDVDIQRIFLAMQRYGLIVADNGSDLFVQGTMDQRWNNDVLNPAFHAVRADDFQVVELGWRP